MTASEISNPGKKCAIQIRVASAPSKRELGDLKHSRLRTEEETRAKMRGATLTGSTGQIDGDAGVQMLRTF